MNWDSGFYILFYTKWKYFDMLDNYAQIESPEYENDCNA